jgi:hypothetical protein
MAYLLLIHEPHGQRATRTAGEADAVYARMVAWAGGLAGRGLLKAGESLATQDARTVRVHAGRVFDGPFAEAKEMVGGFFLLDCATREEAIAIARTCPAAEWAAVEVRAVAPCSDGSG